jgi:hypothetical protein
MGSFQLSPTRMIVAFSIASVILSMATAARAQTPELDHFLARDFWKQRLSENELMRLYELTKNDSMTHPLGPQPWHLWKTNGAHPARYIFLLGAPLFMIPGGSSASVQLFDATENSIATWSFQTGWRINLVNASLEYSSKLSGQLMVLRTQPAVNARNIAKEYFAIAGDRLRLVRLENDKGELVQNEYIFPNYEIGLIPLAKTTEDWAAVLESEDIADVLSALVFLGGRHIDGPDRDFGPGPHESESGHS